MVADSKVFDDFFSGLPERDEAALHDEAAELTVGGLRGVVATVSLIEDQLVSLRTPDAGTVSVFNDLYPELRLGDPVMVYPDGSGGWSLACSAWWISADFDRGEPRRSYGSLLDFVPEAFDDARDSLIGKVNGIDAELTRSDLIGLARSSIYSLELDVGRSLKVRIVDPRQRPMRLCADLTKRFTKLYEKQPLWSNFLGEDQFYWRAGHFLLAVLELLDHRSSLPAKIVSVEPGAETGILEVELYGVRLPIRDSFLSWKTDHGGVPTWRVGETIPVGIEIELATDWLLPRLVSRSNPEWRQLQEMFPVGARIHAPQIAPEPIDSTTRGLQRRGVFVEVLGCALRAFGLIPYGELTRGNDPYHYDRDRLTDGELEVIGYDTAGPWLVLSRVRCLPSRGRQFSCGELVPVMTRSYREMLLAYWDWGYVAVLPQALKSEIRQFSWLRVAAVAEDRVVFDRVVNRRLGQIFQAEDGEKAVRFSDATFGVLREGSLATVEEDDEFGLSDVKFSSSGPLMTLESCRVQPGARMWAKVIESWDYRLFVDLYGETAVIKTILWNRALRRYTGKHLDIVVTEVSDDGEILAESSLLLEEQNRLLARSQGKTNLPDPKSFAASWQEVEAAFQISQIITGRIIDRIKGGLTVDVDVGPPAFLPASLADLKPGASAMYLETLKGRELRFKVIALDRKRNNIVLSRKAVLEMELAKSKAETLERLRKTDLFVGKVKNITDYGVFVDLGGIDGLLHINDISWGRVSHPSKHFSIGDEIEVVVLKFDPDSERVSLGYKQRGEDPWDLIGEKYPIGSRVNGKVASLVDYGAFVELEEGVEGLIHRSEMSWTQKPAKKYKDLEPGERLQIGDEVEAIVCELDTEQRRISMSLRQTERNPYEKFQEAFSVGSIIEGQVRDLVDYGAFVDITGDVGGLIHISDMGRAKRVRHPSHVLAIGDTVKARVTDIDVNDQRVSLSIKEFLPNEWEHFIQQHQVGDTVDGKVVNVTDFGLFIDIFQGLEGLAHISEIDLAGGNLTDRFKVDDRIRVRILRIEEDVEKIALTTLDVIQPSSIEAAEASESQENDLQGQDCGTSTEVEATLKVEAEEGVDVCALTAEEETYPSTHRSIHVLGAPFVDGKRHYHFFCCQLKMKKAQLEAALQRTISDATEYRRPLTYVEFEEIASILQEKGLIPSGSLQVPEDQGMPTVMQEVSSLKVSADKPPPITLEHQMAQAQFRIDDILDGQITHVGAHLSIKLTEGIACRVDASAIDLPTLDISCYAGDWVSLTDHYRIDDWVRVRILSFDEAKSHIEATMRGIAQPGEQEMREVKDATQELGQANEDRDSPLLRDVPVSLE